MIIKGPVSYFGVGIAEAAATTSTFLAMQISERFLYSPWVKQHCQFISKDNVLLQI